MNVGKVWDFKILLCSYLPKRGPSPARSHNTLHGLGKVWGTLHPVSLDVERLDAWGCPWGLGQCFSDHRHQHHMGLYWKRSFQGSAQTS